MAKVHKCGDCGKKSGEPHMDGCDIERCPKCGHQLLSCDCNFPQVTIDCEYLVDDKKKQWKRHLVQNSIDEDFDIQ